MNASKAAEIAGKVHARQKYGDRPYIDHLADVARRVSMDPRAWLDHIVVAWLHDAIEDSPAALAAALVDQLARDGATPAQLDALAHITRRADEDYPRFIARALLNPIAALVKLHDLESNLANNPPERLERKYLIARQAALQSVATHEKRGAYVARG